MSDEVMKKSRHYSFRDQIEQLSVLVVDDDPSILSAAQRRLRDFNTLTAGCPTEALDILEMQRHPDTAGRDIAVVLSDFDMPLMNGERFLGEVKSRYPRTGRILMSAGGRFQPNGVVQYFIKKPFSQGEPVITVYTALIGYLAGKKNGKR